jgi:16S rRNA (cytosine1402-N4)-methyltransferase
MWAHKPVMLEQVLEFLDIKPNDRIVDCTLGEGGHSEHFLEHLEGGKLLGIEQDAEILAHASERLSEYGEWFIPVRDNFSNLRVIIQRTMGKRVDKIFFDLGISMYHIKESGRGFSFSKEEPLDMRLDTSKPLSAKDVINGFNRKKLTEIIWAYGEERFSNRIAHYIVTERMKKPITTSSDLADIVMRAIPKKFWPRNIHPATKTFQAIRIFVNDEIEILERAIRAGIDMLRPGGRICVISFHSLEDRIVKSVFQDLNRGCHCPPDFPVCVCGGKRVIKVLTKKPLQPDEHEIEQNPASRSAKLRCAMKLNTSEPSIRKEEMRYSA